MHIVDMGFTSAVPTWVQGCGLSQAGILCGLGVGQAQQRGLSALTAISPGLMTDICDYGYEPFAMVTGSAKLIPSDERTCRHFELLTEKLLTGSLHDSDALATTSD